MLPLYFFGLSLISSHSFQFFHNFRPYLILTLWLLLRITDHYCALSLQLIAISITDAKTLETVCSNFQLQRVELLIKLKHLPNEIECCQTQTIFGKISACSWSKCITNGLGFCIYGWERDAGADKWLHLKMIVLTEGVKWKTKQKLIPTMVIACVFVRIEM